MTISSKILLVASTPLVLTWSTVLMTGEELLHVLLVGLVGSVELISLKTNL